MGLHAVDSTEAEHQRWAVQDMLQEIKLSSCTFVVYGRKISETEQRNADVD